MTDWPESRRLAGLYQSPFDSGIGFAQYASSGTVTPELWKNIERIESDAAQNPGDPAVERWAEDMEALRAALTAEGIRPMPKFSEFDRNHLVAKLQSLHSIIQTGLNAHNGDGEWSALVDAGIELGLEYNEEEDKYE